MSTTQTIEISFTVDGAVADTARIMNDLIAHIQAIGGTRDLKATQKRVVEQWWTNPIPQRELTNPLHYRQVGEDIYPAPPTLQRQQAVHGGGQCLSDDWPVMEPTEEPRLAPRSTTLCGQAFEEAVGKRVSRDQEQNDDDEVDAQTSLNKRVYESGDHTLIGDGERLTGTGACDDPEPAQHYATRYKRCLLVHTPYQKGERILIWSVNDEEIVLGHWNETLKGYVVRPTPENVKEVCEWLEELNA